MSAGTRSGAAGKWTPTIYKSTTVHTKKGSQTDVVTLWMKTIDSHGVRRDSYNTYISHRSSMQVAGSRKDGDHYHKRMCAIAKEELEEREKEDEMEDA
jgi:hypothetical protein